MDAKPRTDMTLVQAMESLNYFDLQDIRAKWKVTLAEAETKGDDLTYAVVWVLEKRANPDVKVDEIKAMSMREINDYFTKDEEQDFDPLAT